MNAKQTLHQVNLVKWSSLFQDQKSSGLSVKDWCSQNGVTIHAYYYWKRIAKEAYVQSILPDIVPIKPSPLLPVQQNTEHELRNLCNSTESKPEISDNISITIGDVKIEAGASISDETLSRLIKAVRHA